MIVIDFLMNEGLFFLLQLINVIMSTMRSIITIKGKVHTSAIFNAISYTFYNCIVKLITSQNMGVIIIVTFITNWVGVYIARFILDKFRKDKLWIYMATLNTKNTDVDNIIKMLKVADIKHVYNEIEKDKLYSFQIFAPTQSDSSMIENILNKYNIKHYVTEARK